MANQEAIGCADFCKAGLVFDELAPPVAFRTHRTRERAAKFLAEHPCRFVVEGNCRFVEFLVRENSSLKLNEARVEAIDINKQVDSDGR